MLNMNYKKSIQLSLLLISYLILQCCSNGNASEFSEYDMFNATSAKNNLITAGQPSKADLKRLAKRGVKVIVNLRAIGEFNKFNEKVLVEELGMKYVHIPMKGGQDITANNAQRLDLALNGLKESTVVHCASSNRVGGLLAYRAFSIQKQTAKDAYGFGKKTGMSSTEKQVRKLLNY